MVAPTVCFVVLLLGPGCTNTLNRAIYREHPEAVQKFLAQGADVNAPNDDGSTPLIYAAQYGDLALIKTLVERGAKVNAVNHLGNSALIYLVSAPLYKNESVAFLLAHGAEINRPNNEGHAALHRALARACQPEDTARQTELINLLLRAGADANQLTNRHELPFTLRRPRASPTRFWNDSSRSRKNLNH
jgi:ankyrin repeat protein